MAVANGPGCSVSVLSGHGDGTLGERIDFGTGDYPIAVVVADFDADGDPDMAAPNMSANTFTVLLNQHSTVGVETELPVLARVSAAAPNPTRAGASMLFDLPARSAVRAWVFDVTGRQVQVIAERDYEPGVHLLIWDGRNCHGVRVTPGLYYCRVSAAGREFTRPIISIR